MKLHPAHDSGSEAGSCGSFDVGNSTVVAAFSVSKEGVLLAANGRFAELLGATSGQELVGRRLIDLLTDGKDWSAWRESSIAGEERGVTISFRGKQQHPVLLRGDLCTATAVGAGPASTHLTGVFVDVSEEEKLRRAVQRSARMEALGSLTSGIAHDFNNLLTVLVGNLYLVAEELRDHPKSFSKLKSARDAAKRGADLIRQLLAFARRETVAPDIVNPAVVIEGLMPLLRRALGSNVTIDTQLQRDAGLTRCNGGQLESVIVNLSINARDAIESNGKIVVSLENVQLTARTAPTHGLPAGDYIRIAVADNGSGIPPEALGRVFEPFFSTKVSRGGTGLGLSMVRWFAEQAGGAAHIESALANGTKVSILLPRAADSAAETSVKTRPLSTLPSGDESILVFAREEGLRSTIKQILEVLGYEVHLCADPSEALNTIRTKRIDLLLIDAAAQQSSPRQHLIREALGTKPNLKLILATDEPDPSRVPGSKGIGMLVKPFSLADLAGTVRNVLGNGKARGT